MMKVLIIEDEAKSADKLQKYLARLDSTITVLSVLTSIKESIQYLKNHLEPDLIFLDVELTDGISFDIFRKVPITSFIVFVTAYDQHSLRAFDLNTISYLLKPFDQSDVAKALSKYKAYQQGQPHTLVRERFVVQKGNRNYIFSTDDIAYFIKDTVVYLVSNSGEKYLFESSLSTLEKSLNSSKFFRISRNCIVNYNSIESFTIESSHRYRLVIKAPGDHQLLVSQARAADFKKWVQPYN